MFKKKEEIAIRRYLRTREESMLTHPFGKAIDVFSISGVDFAYLERDKQPLRLSLRSDIELSKLLREKYEEVAPAHKLDQRKWNTIILSGQLGYDEIIVLIDHSYLLAKELKT